MSVNTSCDSLVTWVESFETNMADVNEFKCRLCPFRCIPETEIVLHCNKHKCDDPTRLRGGSLDDFLTRQFRKTYQLRAAPYTFRPIGILNPVQFNTFVPLAAYLSNPAAIKPSAVNTNKRSRTSSSQSNAKRQKSAGASAVPSLLSLSLSTPAPPIPTSVNAQPVSSITSPCFIVSSSNSFVRFIRVPK